MPAVGLEDALEEFREGMQDAMSLHHDVMYLTLKYIMS